MMINVPKPIYKLINCTKHKNVLMRSSRMNSIKCHFSLEALIGLSSIYWQKGLKTFKEFFSFVLMKKYSNGQRVTIIMFSWSHRPYRSFPIKNIFTFGPWNENWLKTFPMASFPGHLTLFCVLLVTLLWLYRNYKIQRQIILIKNVL